MFKKSRRKIVAAIMSILTALWIGTLAVIYISSYFEVNSTNLEMLKEHAALYTLSKQEGGSSGDFVRPTQNRGHHANTNQFKLSTFYTVAVSYEGETLAIQNTKEEIYTNAELETLAQGVLKKSAESGVTGDLIYYRTDKDGYTLVAFMDNTIIRESMGTLFRYTLIFGGVAIVCLFFLAVYLAKRIVKPLEESYQKQKQFISDAGHELKTPVSVVNANAELLSREIGDNQWLQNIQYENERMVALVTQLLELARTEDVTPEMEHIDFSRLVDGEVLPFEGVAFEQGLRIQERITDGLTVRGNSAQLRQLVSILLDNAIRHGKGGNDVWLSLSREHGHAKLSVINVGNEIPAEQRAQLFERFYRVDSARNGEDKHYGLGLAIAKSITEVHRGTIDIHCFNGFVEFRVLIPLV